MTTQVSREQGAGERGIDQLSEELGMPEGAIRILQAAMELFARKGYAATSVREIVQEADVTNPMLYYYFNNKEGVFTRLIDLLFGSIEQRVTEALEASQASLEEQVRHILAAHLDGALESPRALQFVYSVLFGPRDSRPAFDLVARRRATFEGVERIFAQAIERGELEPHPGFDPAFLTVQLFGVINQHLMYALKAAEHEESGWMEGGGEAHEGEQGGECACLEVLLGEQARERLMTFFFAGAGRLRALEEPEGEGVGAGEGDEDSDDDDDDEEIAT